MSRPLSLGEVQSGEKESVIQAKGPLVQRLETRKVGGFVWPA